MACDWYQFLLEMWQVCLVALLVIIGLFVAAHYVSLRGIDWTILPPMAYKKAIRTMEKQARSWGWRTSYDQDANRLTIGRSIYEVHVNLDILKDGRIQVNYSSGVSLGFFVALVALMFVINIFAILVVVYIDRKAKRFADHQVLPFVWSTMIAQYNKECYERNETPIEVEPEYMTVVDRKARGGKGGRGKRKR